MPPLGLLQRLRQYWPYGKATVVTSIIFTVLYVAPFYLSSATRPSATLSRDSPSVIRARIRSVLLSCALCGCATAWILSAPPAQLPYWETLRLLGWWPVSVGSVGRTLLLTGTLFLGPLFERLVAEGGWREYATGRPLAASLGSAAGFRNYVAGPMSEELLFRALLVPLALLSPMAAEPATGLSGTHARRVVLATPLYFGLAHAHHLYEFRVTMPHVPLGLALAQTVFQLTYTTLFGWFAAFVFVRTGSLPAVVAAHAFCNWMGLPRLWGRVRRPEPSSSSSLPDGRVGGDPGVGPAGNLIAMAPSPGKLKVDAPRRSSYVRTRPSVTPYQLSPQSDDSLLWSVAYYVLLVAGAVGFYRGLWPLTQSAGQLAEM